MSASSFGISGGTSSGTKKPSFQEGSSMKPLGSTIGTPSPAYGSSIRMNQLPAQSSSSHSLNVHTTPMTRGIFSSASAGPSRIVHSMAGPSASSSVMTRDEEVSRDFEHSLDFEQNRRDGQHVHAVVNSLRPGRHSRGALTVLSSMVPVPQLTSYTLIEPSVCGHLLKT